MLFHGGPVARDGYIVVTLLRAGAAKPLRFTPVRDRLGTLALSAVPEDVAGAVDTMRVFVGYSAGAPASWRSSSTGARWWPAGTPPGRSSPSGPASCGSPCRRPAMT